MRDVCAQINSNEEFNKLLIFASDKSYSNRNTNTNGIDRDLCQCRCYLHFDSK